MCSPILGAAVGILSQVASFAAASADYQNRAAQWKQNYVNALAAGRDEQASLLTRTMQEEEAKDQRVQAYNIEEAQKKADAEVSAAEGGVGGISIDNIIQDMGRRAAWNRQTEERNFEMTAMQLAQEMRGTNTRIENRINSVERPVAPSPFGLVLGVVGSGLKMVA